MPSNKKIQITDAGENNLLPHTSLDNLQVSKTDNTSVTLATEIGATGSTAAIPTEHAVRQALDEKQDNFAAGENVSTESSNGVSLEVSSAGVLGVHADKTSASGFGTVKVGTNITVSDGVISIPDASTSAKGVVRIDTSVSNGVELSIDGGTAGVSVAKTSASGFGTVKVGTNITVSDGVISIPDASASEKGVVRIGSGLKIGASTTSDAGKVVINDASVETTLQDVRIDDGSTVSPVNDQVLTPGNLRGALSVGQAVDVSCAPYNNSGSIVYVNNDFLQGFTATMVNGTTVGFYDTTTHRFPKFADNLVYLFIADVSGSGTVTPNGASAVILSGTPQRIWTKVTASGSGYISASANATMTVTNWRQYEVTALTDEAIAYIAQLPDPDAFFRSSTIFQVRDKYLVKQDMVCPWIFTIGMPDNSDLTVGAGLSYKIRYTNDNTHKITADTIPTDAYGWDAHIQMFIKGTSSIVFQKPLILMDALTPNAGHNLLVKFRNGDAYVYVEDTNAGYIVTEPSGTGAGTLNFGIVDPETDYVIFAATLDGTTVSAGTAAFVGGSTITTLNILGNGTDATTITGDISAASGMTINLQSLTIDGGTFGGTGTIDLDDVCINEFITNNSTNLSIQAVDVSANNNTVVITGGTITAESGAQVIPYGETEPVAVKGTGNKLLNNGKLGYLVSDPAATTDANTLYDALVDGGTAYSNIIFDPALNGQTIYCAAVTNTSTETQTIYGNGPENTTLGSSIQRNYLKIINFEDLTISAVMNVRGDFKNVVFTGGSSVTQYASTLYVYRSSSRDRFPVITNCVFKDTNAPNYRLVSAIANTYVDMINCLVTGNTVGWGLKCDGSSNNPSRVTLTGCTFTNNTFNNYAYENSYAALSSITDCVFDSGNDIKITGGSVTFAGTNTINSTISGAGTIVFADSSTLDLSGNTNSTVISGGTITVDPTAKVIPYGGTEPQAITGSGNTLSNLGVLS